MLLIIVGVVTVYFLTDLISMVMTLARDAANSDGYCVVLALNIKNAFNSANKSRTKDAMHIQAFLNTW